MTRYHLEAVAVTLEGRRIWGFSVHPYGILPVFWTVHAPPGVDHVVDVAFCYAGVGDDGVLEYTEQE
mgnify:CR=1 FL=1